MHVWAALGGGENDRFSNVRGLAVTARQTTIPQLEAMEPRVLLSSAPVVSAESQLLELAPAGSLSIDGQVTDAGEGNAYRFVAPATGRLTIEMGATDAGIDPALEVYNARGRRIRRNNNISRHVQDSRIRMRVKAGQTYYVLAGGSKGTSGDYQLTLNNDPVDDYGNTAEAAKGVRTSRRGSVRRGGKINYGTDVDLLAVTARKTGTMQVAMDALGRATDLDCLLTASDAAGNVLGYGGDGAGQCQVRFDALAGQTYYLQAAGTDQTVGRYRLVVLTEDPPPIPPPDPPPAPADDATDPVDPTPVPDGDVELLPGQAITTTIRSATGGPQLLVLGTDGNDTITLSQIGGTIAVTTDLGSETFDGDFAVVAVYGFAGSDVIRLDHTISSAGWVYAGPGDDTVFDAGTGSDTLVGGEDDDLLISVGGGDDALYGGTGFDSFWCDTGDAVADAAAAETGAAAVHRIGRFYQPYSTNPDSESYVSLEIAGQDLVDPALTGAAAGYANFADAPLFVGDPQYNDIGQGYLGDCYYLAVLSGYALTDPNIIKQMIVPLGDGTSAVRFFRNNAEVYVRVDADLPVGPGGTLVYASSGADGEMWVPLAEKAYAYFRYGMNSYDSLQGGWMTTVYREITNLSTAIRWSTSKSAEEIFSYIDVQLAAGHNVTLGSQVGGAGPIVGSHAYTVLATDNDDGVRSVTVYNPWGEDGRAHDDNPYDGVLRLTIDQVKNAFIAVTVSLA